MSQGLKMGLFSHDNQAFGESSWQRALKNLVYLTKVEIVAGALLIGSLAGIWRYNHEDAKSKRIPLAFSEIEQTTHDFNSVGQPVPPLTRYYSYTNEIAMKVFESHNQSHEISGSNESFARELEPRVDRSLKIWPLISTYAAEMPKAADDALQSLDKLVKAVEEMPKISGAFNRVWDYDRDDYYYTRRWTTEECDSTGCETINHQEEVYDYSIHEYTYHPAQGESAAQLLSDFVRRYPNLDIAERLHLATKTEADNEYAIWKSRRMLQSGERPTPEDYLAYANTWATGSTFLSQMPNITSHYNTLTGLSPKWQQATKTARSDEFRVSSRYYDGPWEYQLAQNIPQHADAVYASAKKIIDGIHFSREQAGILDAKIKKYIDVAFFGEDKEADKLRQDIMDTATKMYQMNFEKGMDVEPFKTGMVVLFTVLGMIAGGAAGAGVDKLIDNRRRKQGYGSYDGR